VDEDVYGPKKSASHDRPAQARKPASPQARKAHALLQAAQAKRHAPS
jgi:hypothetical protein